MRPFPPSLWPIVAATALCAAPARAADPSDGAFEDEPPPAPVVLRHVPSRFSIDGGLSFSYGMLPQFLGAPAWLGIGGRFAGGRTYGDHRLAGSMSISLEGPIAVQWSTVFEPALAWDWASPKGVLVGASIGPSLLLNADLRDTQGYDLTFDAAPHIALRVGWSQRFSLVARRFYVAVEPKLRIVNGQPAFVAALVIGTGRGF